MPGLLHWSSTGERSFKAKLWRKLWKSKRKFKMMKLLASSIHTHLALILLPTFPVRAMEGLEGQR
jgi:hypothetical protein